MKTTTKTTKTTTTTTTRTKGQRRRNNGQNELANFHPSFTSSRRPAVLAVSDEKASSYWSPSCGLVYSQCRKVVTYALSLPFKFRMEKSKTPSTMRSMEKFWKAFLRTRTALIPDVEKEKRLDFRTI